MPKTGIEPILKSYKESVLPFKLFRLTFLFLFFHQFDSNYHKFRASIKKKVKYK